MLPDVIITSNTLGFGGAERQRVLLANGLAQLGHNVHLRLLQASGPLQSELCDDVVVELRPWWDARRTWPTGSAAIITGTTNTEVAHAALLRSRRIVPFWAVAAHTPPIAEARTYGRLLHALIPKADLLIGLSTEQLQALQEHGRLNRKTAVVPNGIPAGPEPAPLPGLDEVRLCFIGRLTPQKGLDLLIAALAESSDTSWRLDVYGDGPDRVPLEAQVPAQLRDRVAFHGFQQDVRSALDQAHVLVAPSRNEAFPLVVLEALAAGRGVLATPVGAMPAMLTPDTGTMLPPPSSPWPAAVADFLSTARSLAPHWAMSARRHFLDNFTDTEMVRSYQELLLTASPRA